jgi:hypothetical protein
MHTTALLLIGLALLSYGQSDCGHLSYEDKNQTDYGPIRVSRVAGDSKDKQGVAVPNVCLGLFDEQPDHRLLMRTESDASGHFRFADVPPGNYRLVATYDGFSPANAKIRVERHGTKRALLLQMRFAGMDTVSFVEIK